MSTAYRKHRPYAQAYSAPEANYGPRFDHNGPMPYQPHPVSAPPNGRASVKRAALAGRLAGAAVAAALFLGAPILATVTAAPAFAEVDPNGDPDKDRLSNDFEIHITKTMIYDSDTDDDGLGDGDENLVYHTHPNSFDTDNDHFTDGQEVNMYGTNPLDADTDHDGATEFEEYNAGTNMKDPNSKPGKQDPDPDPGQGGQGDRDGDGMKDQDEINGWYRHGTYVTDPDNPDSDGDGVIDGAEDDNGTNPNDPNDN